MVRRTSLLIAVLAVAAMAAPATAAAAAPGALSDLSGTGSCVTLDGSADPGPGSCLADPAFSAFGQPNSVAVAPDGRFVLITDENGHLLQYARDPQSGLLSIPAGTRCWFYDGSGGCGDYRGEVEGDGDALAFSADGRFLYATDESANPGVLVFARDPATGALTQLPGAAGCLTASGDGEAGPGTCSNIRGPSAPNAVRLSDDQRFVYVTDFGGGGILSFARNAATGELTQLPGTQGCISQDGSSEDGAATCQDARLVSDDRALTLAPDGRHAFAADFIHNGVEVFDRDPQTGALTVRGDQGSCMTQAGSSGCRDGRGLSRVYQVAVAVDGRTIYAAGEASDAGVAVLRFDPATGELTQPAGGAGCFTLAGADGDAGTTCTATDALGSMYGIVTGADGRALYALNRALGIETYALDPGTGLLSPLPGTARCASEGGGGTSTPGRCTDMKALQSAYAMAFGPGGTSAYVIDGVRPSLSALRVEARPVCAPQSASTPFATPVALTLPCSDPNGDPFTRQVTSAPGGLTLGPVGLDGALTATPAPGFTGAATFTYTATDASGTSDPATATVSVGDPIPPASPAGTADRTKPTVRLGRLQITKRGITLALTLSEPATVKASLKGRFTAKGRSRILAQRTTRAKAGKATITLKRTKAGAPLRKLQGKRLKAFRAILSVTATDTAGNRTTASTGKARVTR